MALGSTNPNDRVGEDGDPEPADIADHGEPSVPPPPPSGAIRLWQDVAAGVDRSQTVVWKAAVDSLDQAARYLDSSPEARTFVEGHMRQVISILLDQQPSKIGQMEKSCVEESLRRAVQIVAMDLEAKARLDNDMASPAQQCLLLDTLAMVFNRKKAYYKGSKPNWNVTLNGAPEVRIRMIEKFHGRGGFDSLATYLEHRAETSKEDETDRFPPADVLHLLLGAVGDVLPVGGGVGPADGRRVGGRGDSGSGGAARLEDTVVRICDAVMVYMDRTSEEALKRQANDTLSRIRYDLQIIFDKLSATRRKDTFRFYQFWRKLTLKLITSQSLPLRLFGWEQVNELIEASGEMRPPPKYFLVEGAGRQFVNGRYVYTGPMDNDGFAKVGGEAQYVMKIPEKLPEKDGGGKTLTLFRCTMRSQQKWWFLSEADEDQPGTDKDEDYYQHKSRTQDESVPPAAGWTTCRNAGVDPPPTLRGSGLMVPLGEEFNTLEHQLARWAIDNGIIELVLGDSVHREVVARSLPLMKFLASMCERDEPAVEITGDVTGPNEFCLRASHLLLAWKTCTSKADAAVSAEVYHLLVAILPFLPDDLAIQLLSAIRKSLRDGDERKKHDLLPEVAEFGSALASASPTEVDGAGVGAGAGGGASGAIISDAVRAEVLNLLWEVVTHPDASSLKPYERLKDHLTAELRVEPYGKRHREAFLGSCTEALTLAAKGVGGDAAAPASVDESFALRMVKLTKFVLEACPREHSIQLVTKDGASLPNLLFQELSSYLMRRRSLSDSPTTRKTSSFGETTHSSALAERLSILRYAYGLSDEAEMNNDQLDHLWELCSRPSDREALMVFMANASNAEIPRSSVVGGGIHVDDTVPSVQQQPYATSTAGNALGAAFSDEVRLYAFQSLICSSKMEWELLGVSAYRSFQTLFGALLRTKGTSPSADGPDIDALWRICLTAGDSEVACRAMKDLLDVYISSPPTKLRNDERGGAIDGDRHGKDVDMSVMTEAEARFVKRIFDCLVQVRKGLEAGESNSELSAERCLRILNAAVGQSNGGAGRTPANPSTMIFSLPSMTAVTSAAEALRLVPHGMRGQACYRTISVLGKRTSPQQNHVAAPAGPVPSVPAVRDESGNFLVPPVSAQVKLPSVVRFSLEVHPLETLASVKRKVANSCNHPVARVKPLSVNGRQISVAAKSFAGNAPDASNMSLNVSPDDSTVAQLGITEGCEVVFLLAGQPLPANTGSGKKALAKTGTGLNLAKIFAADDAQDSDDHFFDTLLAVLEALPIAEQSDMCDGKQEKSANTSKLVWDLLLAMPSNPAIVERVRSVAFPRQKIVVETSNGGTSSDDMVVDSPRCDDEWTGLLDGSCFHRSVYTMQVVDACLQPAPEILCNVGDSTAVTLKAQMLSDAASFRRGFIDTGGFDAVLRQFTAGSKRRDASNRPRTNRIGDAVALRVLKCCFIGNNGGGALSGTKGISLDECGKSLLQSLSEPQNLLFSLTEVVVSDYGVADATILDSLLLLRLLLLSKSSMADLFISLPNGMAETFVTTMLLRESKGVVTPAAVSASARVRKSTHDLILKSLAHCSLPWLIKALKDVEVTSESTEEFFDVIQRLVEGNSDVERNKDTRTVLEASHLKNLGTATCEKMSAHPRPTSESAAVDFSTGVLCGCLKLLRALIETGGGAAVKDGCALLLKSTGSSPWSKLLCEAKPGGGMFEIIAYPWRGSSGLKSDDAALVDLMGAIFDGFLSSAETLSSSSICCDRESRKLGFDVVAAAARFCEGGDGYLALVTRVRDIISAAAPSLRHKWAVSAAADDGNARPLSNTAKYSGLRNQGCTCYMNSLLQQLFMMPEVRKNICSAPIPSSLRSSGSGVVAKGADLVGKKISLQWENGMSYEAHVERFEPKSGMHTIRYCPLSLASGNTHDGSAVNLGHQSHHHQPQYRSEDVATLPDEFPEEFFLAEGRPGKETGVFEVLSDGPMDISDDTAGESSRERRSLTTSGIEETEEEIASRRLLEEVQRTFVHLEEGARGRCFDPRSLVEASGCLKLEFDVWQQNDASEYAMKLLDRLEVALKRWAPEHFKYLTNTFGLKQTKQKYCKECGLKTNREENHMTIDCQIRGKSDIHEALAAVCEVEYMEGDNQITCDRCEKKTDSILRTAISALPQMLVLSLKRFDLDYATFETVKLNSRCAFGQTLNMKRYTLEGVEAMEKANKASHTTDKASADDVDSTSMETELLDDPLDSLPDQDYEYKLAGVLVHAGVAQGGHYYSYIRDRFPSEGGEANKWYRFDDEDVTPFDPSSIEVECFGGKVKKETKWPNGQVHTVESEQFANALMLFYEKVTPPTIVDSDKNVDEDKDCPMEEHDSLPSPASEVASGYDVFQPDVRRSNTTHSWHTFLFDAEFQSFLKGLLGLCMISPSVCDDRDGMEVSTPSPSPSVEDSSWRLAVIQMSISFVFDILLHSADHDAFNEWVRKIAISLNHDRNASKWFIHELAKRTREVSANWLRTYCTDCPEPMSRVASMNIVSCGVQRCLSCPSERSFLHNWTEAWNSQWEAYQRPISGKRQNVGVLPTQLEGQWKSHESVEGLEKGTASSIGVLISAFASFLELAPRSWRTSADLSILLRDIGSIHKENFGEDIRKALVAAQIPARLMCLSIRDRSPPFLRAAFPGASVSVDLAEVLLRGESTPSSHMMTLPGGMSGGGGVTNSNPNLPLANDFVNLMEALGCIIGAEGVKRAPLIVENDGAKSRSIGLTPAAREALTAIFHEFKSPTAGGMGQREIHSYMNRCGVDMKYVPGQKIMSILNKYPTIPGRDGSKESRYLSLEGFLTYYRDTAQSQEMKVRADLHTFGFRLDLTPRPEELNYVNVSGSSKLRDTLESAALDAAALAREKQPKHLGSFAEMGLDSYHLHSHYHHFCDPMAAYLLAASAYGRDSTRLLVEALQILSRAPTGGNGRDTLTSCVVLFKVLLSIPDERQIERIKTVMQSTEKATPYAERGVGLLVAAKELSSSRNSQHYSAEYHFSLAVDRYIEIVRELYGIPKVTQWMSEHRDVWGWMEQWGGQHHQGGRSDGSGRGGDGSVHSPSAPGNHHYSDSDVNTGMGNDSEDDDDEYRYDNVENFNSFSKISVQGAGVAAVNGLYVHSGSVDGVGKYTKAGNWEGREETFSLYRCQLNDRTRKWFISVVPRNSLPGTNKDIDFYWSSGSDDPAFLKSESPPARNWQVAKDYGQSPAPICVLLNDDNLDDDEDGVGDGNGQLWHDEDDAIDDRESNLL